MSVSGTNRKQAMRKINKIVEVSDYHARPLGGWIATFQYAIGMSVATLAVRLGISRNSVYMAIRNEKLGSITLNHLNKVAGAMGGKLVYAIIPQEGPVEEIVIAQARFKAKKIVQQSYSHMALEEQTKGLPAQADMIEELANEMVREMPRNFWT